MSDIRERIAALPSAIRDKIAIASDEECWLWIGSKKPTRPEGSFRAMSSLNGKTKAAAKVIYELLNGAIPADRWVLHKCDNPMCVNPHHLYAGTMKDNVEDRVARRRGARVLNDALVLQIVELRRGGLSKKKTAKKLGVPASCVRDVWRGASWNHLTGIPRRNDYLNRKVATVWEGRND